MSRVFEEILGLLEKRVGFSDLHLKEGAPMKLRAPRGLVSINDARLDEGDMTQLMDRLSKSVLTIPWRELMMDPNYGGQIDFATSIGDVRFRCNAYFFGGRRLGLVMRRIQANIPDIAQLGLPESIIRLTGVSSGLILTTGATGSGKSTTQAAMINNINKTEAVKIITLEDPVEYIYQDVKADIIQREIGPGKDSDNFSMALRAALREDPDVIMVGELRDAETADMVLKAAETGHLVFATMHTRNAERTVSQLLSLFPAESRDQAREKLSASLLGVISQVLVPSTDGKRKHLAYEVMLNTMSIASLIRENKMQQLRNTIDQGSREGMCLLNTRLRALVNENKISQEDALATTYDQQEFLQG